MNKAIAFIALASAALGGCQSVGGPGVSDYYDCDRGLRLKVDRVGDGVLVAVGNARPIALRPVAAAHQTTFEGAGGSLRITGDTATWTGRTREAPYTCRRVMVPR
jgi:hypothetical protein